MSIARQLHVVEPNQIEELKRRPALVLGKNLMAGLPICHLHETARPIHGLISGEFPTAEGSAGFLLTGGVVLSDPETKSQSARLLDPADVQAFHHVLKRWSEAQLYRRFHGDVLAASGIDSPGPVGAGWSDAAGWDDECEEEDTDPDLDDWTLEQAEEFERLADALQALRSFVEKAAQTGRGIVLLSFPPASAEF